MMTRLYRLLFVSVLFTISTGCRDTEFAINNTGSSDSGTILTASVTGKVTDNLGNPIENVTIVTLPFGRDFTTNANGRRIISNNATNSEGQYLIQDLPQGTYKILFLASGKIKVTQSIGPVDFNPENLIDGNIVKGAVLQPFPETGDGDTPEVALFDPEDKKRMTELLTSYGIRYTNITDQVSSLDTTNYNVFVVGLDATIYQEIEQLIAQANIIDSFLENGGSIYLGQLNDFSFEGVPLPFLTGDQQFALRTEGAPFNDFTSGFIEQSAHMLVDNVQFTDWSFIEAGQQTLKQNVVFDSALKSPIENSLNWNILVTAPANDFSSGDGNVLARSDIIIAEYTDPRSGSKIVLNQAAYYQATFGDQTDPNATQLTNNVINYIKLLNTM